jgi:hypothetical protein
MASPIRKELKGAMLAMLREADAKKRKARSREFTKLLFSFAESLKTGESEDEISSFQMEAVGLFSTYLFRKREEKGKQELKGKEGIFREIAEESDELFDEIEERARS